MTSEILRKFLNERGVSFEEKPIQGGQRFECKTREIFNVFDTGNISYQGKSTGLTDEVRALTQGAPPTAPAAIRPVAAGGDHGRPIFIVYGHDAEARNQLELILRRMGVSPIILDQLSTAGDTVIEKLERYLGEHGNVGYACVLLTPDDEGNKVTEPEKRKYRARQNVVLELGMVLARLGRRRVAILHKQSIELPSDIAGLLYIPFVERVEELRNRIFTELQGAGYTPNPAGLN